LYLDSRRDEQIEIRAESHATFSMRISLSNEYRAFSKIPTSITHTIDRAKVLVCIIYLYNI